MIIGYVGLALYMLLLFVMLLLGTSAVVMVGALAIRLVRLTFYPESQPAENQPANPDDDNPY